MSINLLLIWAVIVIFCIMMYVVVDGSDLGIDMLYPFFKDSGDRNMMMNTVAPVQDDNETQPVLGGAALFGAFPLVYAVALSALYLPLIFILIGLIFRSVAFESHFKVKPAKQYVWDEAFIGDSPVVTFFQSMALGAFIEGVPVENCSPAGGSLDRIAPFPLFCGLTLIVAYTLLGCIWLITETEGHPQERMHDLVRPLALMLLVIIGVVSLWTPLAHAEIVTRWFNLSNLFWFLPVPTLVLVTFHVLLRLVANNGHVRPFMLILVLIFLGYSGLGTSLWPNVTPPAVSTWEVSAPPQSQGFMLVGTLFIIPSILGYTVWNYYVFRGKVKHGDGYH